MRTVLHEFFPPTKEELEKLWAGALITFDASSLLNLYGYSSETKAQLIAAYEQFRDRIVLPYQFALEYSRNRAKVISKQISNFSKATKDLTELLNKHNQKKEQPYLSEGSKTAIEGILEELSTGKKKFESSMASDEESDLLLKLFDEKIGPEPNSGELQKLYGEAKSRYEKRVPPGFADVKEKNEPDCYGDYIGWKQIINIATEQSKDIILVTDDSKEDWWHLEGERLVGPLPALRKEFRSETAQSIWIYNTEGFLRAAQEYTKVDVASTALDEVSEALSYQFVDQIQRLKKPMSAHLRTVATLPYKGIIDLKKKAPSSDLIEPEEEEE